MQCNPLKANRRVGGTCRLHIQVRRICQPRHQRKADGFLLLAMPVSRLAYSSTLMMEVICFSETSVKCQLDYTALYPKR
jgi:hypothetical protein